MNEFDFIEAIKQQTYKQASVIKGIGDDAAVIQSSVNDLVTAVDTFVENVHFTWEHLNGFHIGYRALAANISDLAAMGATPKYYLVSIVVPDSIDQQSLLTIFDGMNELADEYQMDLIGGDTVSGKELVISITVIGTVSGKITRYRSNARNGDIVFVTGTLGDSSAGLYILNNNVNIKGKEYFINRHRMPTPRIDFIQPLHQIKRMALNDVSDGIGSELQEIAHASNVDIIIDDTLIPIHHDLRQFPYDQQTEWKYYGGEDFELVGTVDKENWPLIQQAAANIDVKVTKIGKVIHKKAINPTVYLQKDKQLSTLKKSGYIHMNRRKCNES